ncbi:MAG: VWA domain-containing protein [Candidatus Aminicenantes bacterium]|nr:VWA domain-containing protein [Candidatus Aminicenantes bacterium]
MKIHNPIIKSIYLGLFLLLGFSSVQIYADGFIIPQPRRGELIPPLSVKYHRVEVNILGQVAKTTIDQVFINHYTKDIEGVYIFPLPEGASLSEFSMYIGDKKVDGEILDRDQARRVYEDIVRRMKDPALLEYVGRNLFRARVYPIPALGEKRIKLSYTEILKSESRLVRYLYPLNTEKFSARPLEDVSVSVNIKTQIPISNVYSPSHKVSIRKIEKNHALVGYEGKNIKPEKDFIVYYSLSEDDIGLSFMNWSDEKDNYFLFMASPSFVSPKAKVINKNIIFVLDSSGSMSGKKIVQAKEAARFVIDHLDPGDMFSLIDFDDGVDFFSQKMVAASQENIEKALRFVENIEDSGGTNINEALSEGLGMITQGERPSYILFLTDGLPTVGVTDTAAILKNIDAANDRKSRIFAFGVGYDVNTELLDRISSGNRGTSVYVSENDNLEVAISQFYEKISSPLLSDIIVKFSGIETKDVYPKVLPDLFKGSQILMIGKYRGEGRVSVELTGSVEKEIKQFVLNNHGLTKDDSYDFLPRLWATRRIGFLLEEIRLNLAQDELIEEVKKLGIKFGIVTPYTSFLVTEKEQRLLDAAAPEAQEAMAARKTSGAGAFRIAKATQEFKEQEQAVQVESQLIRYRSNKTFFLKDEVWMDSVYAEGNPVKEIVFGSDEYFKLMTEKPDISKYLSVAGNILIVFEGTNYRIIPEEKN